MSESDDTAKASGKGRAGTFNLGHLRFILSPTTDYWILNSSRFLPLIQTGSLPRPDHVAPVSGLRNLAATLPPRPPPRPPMWCDSS